MNLLDTSISIAIDAHNGANNKHDNEPYLLHPHRVAICLRDNGYSERYQAIGWLHDVVEDNPDWPLQRVADTLQTSDGSYEDILFVLQGLDGITKRAGEPNVDAINRCKRHPGSRAAKWFDSVAENFRRTHLITDEATRARLTLKYSRNVEILGGPGPVE